MAKLEDDKAYIDTFLMSCRVMGRNVEKDFLAHIEKGLRNCGCKQILAEYVATPKNSVVKDFWQNNGYTFDGAYWLKSIVNTMLD